MEAGKQYKDTAKHLDSLKAELGEVMGAGIHGQKGNQLTGSGWFGRKMGELSADGEKVRLTQLGYPDGPPPMPQRPPVPEGHPDRESYEEDLKEILDAVEPDREDDTSVTSYGGGYADFFREQREGEKGGAGQGFGDGYADFFREQREGDASEDTRKDTGYEYISKQDFDSKIALLDTKLEWNKQWMDEADGKLAVNPSDESAQRVYNFCLQNVIELKKQINELNEQRTWSEKVEMSDIPGNSNGFDNPDEAAIAFLKMY